MLVGLCRRTSNDAVKHHRIILYARAVVMVVAAGRVVEGWKGITSDNALD